MTIILKKNGTVEPFGLKLIRQTQWNLMPPTRSKSEEADEYDGEVDFGAEFSSQDLILHCITEEGLSIDSKYQKKIEIANILKDLQQGDWLIRESVPDKKIFVRFTGRVEVEEYPSWLKVIIPLKMEPFWIKIYEEKVWENGQRIGASIGDVYDENYTPPFVIVNSGTFSMPVLLELQGIANSPTITMGDKTLKFHGNLASNDTLSIDTDKYTVKINNTNALALYEGGFPHIGPGEAVTVSHSGGGTLTAKFYSRYV